jgi:hypothetical protein
MDHPTTYEREVPWKTTALVAAAFAAFELLFILVVGLALVGKAVTGDGSPAPARAEAPAAKTATPAAKSAKPKPARTRPTLSRSETSVVVLNGNGSPGAASDRADLVQTKGYLIAGTANAPRTDFARSVVMYRPGYRPEAKRLATDFGVGRVAPLDGLRPSDLQGAHVALIVGAE